MHNYFHIPPNALEGPLDCENEKRLAAGSIMRIQELVIPTVNMSIIINKKSKSKQAQSVNKIVNQHNTNMLNEI